MLMRFRPATQNDLPVVISWIPDAVACKRWAGPAVSFPLTPSSLAKEIEFSPDNSYCLEEKGNLVGFGQLLPKSENRLHAARIIVAPHQRGRGFGRKLGQALINRAIALKYPRVSLNVYKDNPTAINLYQSLGFHEIDKSKEKSLAKDIRYMELKRFG
jgi:ribosomal protein S18 acetylase RimI-like enzyme